MLQDYAVHLMLSYLSGTSQAIHDRHLDIHENYIDVSTLSIIAMPVSGRYRALANRGLALNQIC